MAARKDPAGQAGELAQVKADNSVLASILSNLIVHVAPGQHPATLRQICVQELRIATNAQVDVLEQLLAGGG